MRNHFLLLFLTTILISGCGGGAPDDAPKTVAVTGTVTMKGSPVSDASVVFMPKSGPSGVGTTDSSGKFTLKTAKAPGAIPGSHVVTITAGGEIPMPGTEAAKAKKSKPEIPPAYGDPKKSGLTAEVKATGENVIDFKLN
ncbi:MAG: carboxypeptidase-like regulatory domain-containing protein [Gimesia sp.]